MNDDSEFEVNEDEFGDFDKAMPDGSLQIVDESFVTCSSTLVTSPAPATTPESKDDKSELKIGPSEQGNHFDFDSPVDKNGVINKSRSHTTDLLSPQHPAESPADASEAFKDADNDNGGFGDFENHPMNVSDDSVVGDIGAGIPNEMLLTVEKATNDHVQSAVDASSINLVDHLVDNASRCKNSVQRANNDGVFNQKDDNESNGVNDVEAAHIQSNETITIDKPTENGDDYENQLKNSIPTEISAAVQCDNAQPSISVSSEVTNNCETLSVEQSASAVVDEPFVTDDDELMPTEQEQVNNLTDIANEQNEEITADGSNKIHFIEQETPAASCNDFGSFDEAQKQTDSVPVVADTPLSVTNEDGDAVSPAELEAESSVDVNENDQKISDENDVGNFGDFQDQNDKVAEVGNESSSLYQMEDSNGDDFGGFGSFDEVQKQTEPVPVIADTSLSATNEDGDAMSPAELEAESSVDVNENDQKISDENVVGNFDDFQDQNDKVAEVGNESSSMHQMEDGSGGDFGDFGSFDEAQKQTEPVPVIEDNPLPTTNEDRDPTPAATLEAESSVDVDKEDRKILDDNVDGDFGDIQAQNDKLPEVDIEPPMNIENSSGGDFGGFGAFDEAQKQTEPVSVIEDNPLSTASEGAEPASAFSEEVDHESPMKIEDSSGGDFGDFGSFDEAQNQAESVPVIADTPLPMTNEGAEPISAVKNSSSFREGQQESAISSATNFRRNSGDIVEAIEEKPTVEDDHDKVDDFQHQTEMVNVGNKAVEDEEGSDDVDDDFGDFGSFDEAQQEEQILPESEGTPSPAPSQIASTASLLGRLFNSPSSVVEVDIIFSQKSLWNQPVSMTSVLPEIDTNTPKEMRWSAKALKLCFPEIEEIRKIDIQTDSQNCEIKTNRRDTEMKNGVPGKLPDLSFMLSSTLSLPTKQRTTGDI